MKRSLHLAISVLLLQIGITPTSATEAIVLAARVSPVVAPDLNDKDDCSLAAVTVSKADGTPFAKFDELTTWTTEGGIAYQAGVVKSVMVLPSMYTDLLPATVGLRLSLCTRYLRVPTLSDTVTVNIRLSNGLNTLASLSLVVPLVSRSPEAAAAIQLRSACGVDDTYPRFQENLPLTQTRVPRKSGELATIKGTLFRHGFIAAGEPIFLHMHGAAARLGKRLARTVTDSRGQFVFSFPMTGQRTSIYSIYIPARFEPLGPIPGPFPERSFELIGMWLSGEGRIYAGLTDWIPAQSAECEKAATAFLAINGSVSSKIFNDDERHPLALYTAKRITYGLKGKRVFPSYAAWDVKAGGRCYVSGYTTRTGKHVSSYYRSC